MPTIKQSYISGNSRYLAAEIYTPQGVVLHSIGCPQPNAQVLRDNWARNSSPYVTQYVLDDVNIFQTMPNNFKGWHVGSPGNSKWIGIEMGEPKQIKYTSGAKFTVSDLAAAKSYAKGCYDNAVWLIAKLCKDYGWNPYTAILTHNEVSTKMLSNTDHVDPEHLWNGLGLSYSLNTLRNDVAAMMDGVAPAAPPKDDEVELYRVRKTWADAASQIGAYTVYENAVAACKDGYAVFDASGKHVYPFKMYAVRVTASVLNVRKGAGTNHPAVNAIHKGEVYTIVEERNGWGLLKAYADKKDGWISLSYTKRL